MFDHFEELGSFGWAIYGGLLICSLLAIFVIVERLLSLRASKELPSELIDSFVSGDILSKQPDRESVTGRILYFHHMNKPDPEALKAFASLQMARMERGLFILDIVVGSAPLLGLLGTITGLYSAFENIDAQTGLQDTAQFKQDVAMALTTTMTGLAIAIPALVGNSYLSRRVDMLSAQINVGVERLIDLARRDAGKAEAKA